MAVRYDDRLRTVLAQPAAHPHDRAIRWRQLVELLARGGEQADRDLIEEGVRIIRRESALVPESVRMAAARAIAPLPAPLPLICALAADRLSVAAPVLAAARLTASEWAQVLRSAAPECRHFIAAIEGSAPPEEAPALIPPPAADGSGGEPVPSISDVLARIERLRRSREPGDESSAQRPDPELEPELETMAEEPRLFRWECDEAGHIDWVDGAPRGPLIGRSLTEAHAGETDPRLDRAFSLRLPFRDAELELTEGTPVAGAWKISGVPAFEPASGRFAGYRGVAERDGSTARTSEPIVLSADPDSLRELAHEVKTPLNAIIGFAEMIGGEYLGPANQAYRERAQEIVAQARLLLAAIEDLDFAARQKSAGPEPRVDLAALIEQLVERLRGHAATRGAAIEASRSTTDLTAAIVPGLAERLIARMCEAVIDQALPNERLRLSAEQAGDRCEVTISRPAALQGMSDDKLFRASGTPSEAGYWLRLTRSLARMVGADLVTSTWTITLTFPRAPG